MPLLDSSPLHCYRAAMAAPRILPPVAELQKLVDQGMTHAQIASKLSQKTGHKIARSTISAALSRAGASDTGTRYAEEIPWRVRGEHLTQYPVRMLRLLGRRHKKIDLRADEAQRLDNWLAGLHQKNLVVAYSPEAGFMYVEADEVHDGQDGIPIRRRTIAPEELA